MRDEQPEEFRPEFGKHPHERKGRTRRQLAKENIKLRRQNLELRAQLAIVKKIAVLAIRLLRERNGKNGKSIRDETNGSDKCGG